MLCLRDSSIGKAKTCDSQVWSYTVSHNLDVIEEFLFRFFLISFLFKMEFLGIYIASFVEFSPYLP